MTYAIEHDSTQMGTMRPVLTYRDGDETFVGDQRSPQSSNTEFVELKPFAINRMAAGTPFIEELRSNQRRDFTQDASTGEPDALTKASEARITLLVRQYEGVKSREESARLAILTQRIRRLSPRVTADELDAVSEMVDQAEDIAMRIAAVREKFGLK